MLGYFPDPYPDELFYSICARFSDAMRYPLPTGAYIELFGLRGMETLTTLPTGLDHLVVQLPPSALYTSQEFIEANTLFPYYAPFLPSERLTLLQQAMQGKSKEPTHVITGITSHRLLLPHWFRFCPVCVEEDRSTLGACYWHRLHQITGVEVCPVHRVFLQNSDARQHGSNNPSQLISAERAIQLTQPQELDSSNALHQTLLQIGCDTAWLLNQRGLTLDPDGLRQRYVALLIAQGFANSPKVITQMRQVIARMREHFPPELLAILSSELSEFDRVTWLHYLLRRSSLSGQPPVQHLLMMQFLGYTAEKFFALSMEDTPFGQGPWPCLNPTCEFYHQPVIQAHQLQIIHKAGRPRGKFSCVCGFVYHRLGPEQSTEERLRWTSVKTCGQTWETALRKGWENTTISLTKLAQQLGFSNLTIKRYAAALGLPFPRPGGISSRYMHLRLKRTAIKTVEQFLSDREKYQNAWLTGMKEHPQWNRSTQEREMPGVYAWLHANDREWLERVSQRQFPQIRRKAHRVSLQPWRHQRDSQLAEAVRIAAQRLRNTPGRPVRITKAALEGAIHQSGLHSPHHNKLPLTCKALEMVIETHEAFALRRLEWHLAQAQSKGITFTQPRLISKIGRTLVKTSPRLQQAIESALSKRNADSASNLTE